MHWKHYFYIVVLILVIILIILYIIGKRLQWDMLDLDNAESFENPLEIRKDMIDKLYSLVEVDKKRKRKTRKFVRKQHNKLDKTKTRKLK